MNTRVSSGFMTIAVAIGFVAIMIVCLAVLGVASVNHQTVYRDARHAELQLATDAAISEALVTLKTNDSWSGTAGDINYHTHDGVRVTYATSISDVSADKKRLSVTGKFFQPDTSSTPIETRKVLVDIKGSTSPPTSTASVAVLAGNGGLRLGSGSSVIGGDVYSNGTVELTSGSSIGTSSVPRKVYAAHQSCGQSDGTYPRVCAPLESGEPFTVTAGNIIYGEVRGTNQTNGAFMLTPGLIPSTTVPPVAMPDYDRTAQENAVATTTTSSSAGCSWGTRNWSANLKITGNVSGGGACVITINGNAWITGNLSLSSATIKVAEGITTPPVILVDGASGLTVSSGGKLLANSAGVGVRIITYYALGCGACTSVTPSVLANNVGRTTILIYSGTTVSGAELYARWSRTEIYSGSSIKSVAGQTVTLSSGSAAPFTGTVTGFAPPAAAPSGWQVIGYRREY